MQIDLLTLLLAFIAGLGLGAFYTAALWWTVKRLPQVQHPVLWTVGSFYLRLLLVTAGFYVVMGGSFSRLAAAFIGFLTVKFAVTRRLKSQDAAAQHFLKENRLWK